VDLLGSLLRNNRAQIFLHRSGDLADDPLGPNKGVGILVFGLGPLGGPLIEFGLLAKGPSTPMDEYGRLVVSINHSQERELTSCKS